MQGIGDAIEGAMIRLVVLAFVAGCVFAGACWALWYFVLSHISIGWEG